MEKEEIKKTIALIQESLGVLRAQMERFSKELDYIETAVDDLENRLEIEGE